MRIVLISTYDLGHQPFGLASAQAWLKRDGHEVLKWVRSQPENKSVPVVMLTSSARASDVDRAYELGVTSYLRKIASQAEFGQAVRVILKYWLELNIPADQS